MYINLQPIPPLTQVYPAVRHTTYRDLLRYSSVAYENDDAFITKHMVTDLPACDAAGSEDADGADDSVRTDYAGSGSTDNGKHGRAKKRAVYRHITFKEYRADVEALGAGLLSDETAIGAVEPGTHIAIIGINSYP